MNPISVELARQLAEDRAVRLRRAAVRRRTFDETEPGRPRPRPRARRGL